MKIIPFIILASALCASEAFGQIIALPARVTYPDGSMMYIAPQSVMGGATIMHQAGGCNGVQGGCNSGGQQQRPNNNPGGRQVAPLIPPTSPDIPQANRPAPIVIPAKPLLPVPEVPSVPQVAKGCECDNSKILALIEKLSDRNDKLEALIVQIAQQQAKPGPVGPAGPPGAPAKIDLDAITDQLAAKMIKNLRVTVEPLASK